MDVTITSIVDIPRDGSLNLDEKKIQVFLASEVVRHADKYVPFNQGFLKTSAAIAPDGSKLSYNTPYAHYQWQGYVWVDPITGKGAFHDPVSGRFWSRPKTPKVPSAQMINYSGSPMRGAHWVERMYIDEGEQIEKAVMAYISGN